MPQARRKTPFSGKAKKQQLQSKKQTKTFIISGSPSSSGQEVVSLNYQPTNRGGRGDRNRYALKFYRESDAELKMKKEEALKPLNPVPQSELEIDPAIYFPPALDFPTRPPWSPTMTTAQLDANENRYFHEYISSLEKSEYWKHMSYFELNLETWRQLWRVLEMCDILLLVTDIRYTGCMFPPSLYEYIKSKNKNMILVLNKVDLVPPSVVVAWKEYYMKRYPELKVVYFTCCAGYNLLAGTKDKGGLQIRRRKGRLRMCVEGATQLLESCKEIVNGKVDLTSWEKKIKDESQLEMDEDDSTEVGETLVQKPDTSFYEHEKFKNGILTIGCVGQPNVGKSSLMNAIMGKKVVSVSKTPGHTKHFQTIYLTNQVRLCDCPGLVFPSTVPRPIQILMGSYPIAQLREPYTTIRYLSERIDMPKLLRMEHPENDSIWTPTDICAGWAKRKTYLTAKAARLDVYRAANSILRMALDGKICLWLRPPGYKENIEKFETSPEIKYVKWVQALVDDEVQSTSDTELSDSEDESSKAEVTSSDDSTVVTSMANKFAGLGDE